MTNVSKDIKDEVLSKVKSGIPVVELSKQYGIHFRTIYGWLRNKAIGTVSTIEHAKLKRENMELKEIIGMLSLELSKFKKNRRG
ncbi:IS630 transposase-related protein [Patescibacteria group bacterium]|nr:IS630 transposase-related protein [Patescibacteria group bacterium]MBU1952781.1 IS630 transposase-related protein [Patescibacteria group bacterium]